MKTCDTCKWWKEIISDGKPVEGEHTCSHTNVLDEQRWKESNFTNYDACLIAAGGDYRLAIITTGPKFGCIHHSDKTP